MEINEGVWFDGSIAVKRIKYTKLVSIITEIALLTKLQHPNIVALYGADFKTEYAELRLRRHEIDLESFILRSQYAKTETVKQAIQQQLLEAVGFIHQYDVIHADLKPENILLDMIDSKPVIYICDFGISFINNDKKRIYKVQTIHYRAPEITHDKKIVCNEKIDIWSLGCILYFIWYERHLMQVKRGDVDSSILSCKLFKTSCEGAREDRIRRLVGVSKKYVRNILTDKVCTEVLAVPNMQETKKIYAKQLAPINIIAGCLHPNPSKRPAVTKFLGNITNPQYVYLYTKRDLDDLQIINYLSANKIKKHSCSVLNLADNIFNRLHDKTKYTPEIKAKCALLIASCLFNEDESAPVYNETIACISELRGKLIK